jgi:hypothetical protein
MISSVESTTIGVDLSAQARNTACCVLEWGTASARLAHLSAGHDNSALIDLVNEWHPRKVAIDSPFGWPLEFSRTIAEFTATGRWPDGDDRRPLLFRRTDFIVRELTGTDPLSVSTDRLGICAMRCARLLTLLAGREPVDRTGSGLVAEVYPAAALRQWQLDPRGYKGSAPEKIAKRGELLATLASATAAWLELDTTLHARLRASDHLFDALLAALIARVIERKETLPIPANETEAARAEGWIHLPRAQPLAEVAPFG